jgi:hypothetical protein
MTFLHTLDRLDGRVEWGVKVYAESPEASESTESRKASESTESSENPDSRPAPSPAKPVSGRDYLRQRRGQHRAHEEKWERAEEFSRRLHETLSGYAEETRIHAPQNAALSHAPGRNVLNAAYLVPRSESEAFVELVDRTKDDSPGLRVELTGPWAAYSFSGEDS